MPNPCAIGKFEVTNWQFNRFVWERDGKGVAPLTAYPASGIMGTPQRPVLRVSWHDARAYVRWLSTKTGQRWRLPTDAEWEYAARGGLNARFPWGNDLSSGHANCAGCGGEFSGKGTTPVGRFAANAYRLHDMAGNVREWAEAKSLTGSASPVLRGGSWMSVPRAMRAAHHSSEIPSDYFDVGFRVCRDSPIE